MKYAHLEQGTNKLLGWYDDSIHSDIPVDSMEVSDKAWQDAIDIGATYYDGTRFINKDCRTPGEVEAHRVAILKDRASIIINDRYPLHKQLNITNQLDGYTAEDKLDMITFISSVRAKSRYYIAQGSNIEDTDWI